jgi:hypothetical protein
VRGARVAAQLIALVGQPSLSALGVIATAFRDEDIDALCRELSCNQSRSKSAVADNIRPLIQSLCHDIFPQLKSVIAWLCFPMLMARIAPEVARCFCIDRTTEK